MQNFSCSFWGKCILEVFWVFNWWITGEILWTSIGWTNDAIKGPYFPEFAISHDWFTPFSWKVMSSSKKSMLPILHQEAEACFMCDRKDAKEKKTYLVWDLQHVVSGPCLIEGLLKDEKVEKWNSETFHQLKLMQANYKQNVHSIFIYSIHLFN